MLCRILLWNHLVQGFLCVGSFLMTASISSAVIGLFRFSASSSFSLGILYFCRNCPLHLGFQISWHIVLCSNLLQSFVFLCFSCNLCSFISDWGFLIIWAIFFLMRLLKGLLILFMFSKNQLLHLLIPRIVLLSWCHLIILWSLLFSSIYLL